MRMEEHAYEHDGHKSHGFFVYNEDGSSLRKGSISSFSAHAYSGKSWIEFGIQSPTGDSSDFHHFTFPCASFEQAMDIVNEYKATFMTKLMGASA